MSLCVHHRPVSRKALFHGPAILVGWVLWKLMKLYNKHNNEHAVHKRTHQVEAVFSSLDILWILIQNIWRFEVDFNLCNLQQDGLDAYL